MARLLWYGFFLGLYYLFFFFFRMLNSNLFLAIFLSFILVMVIYFVIALIRSIIQRNLLEEKCDPHKCLRGLEKQEKMIRNKPKAQALIGINKAAVHLAMGEYHEAKSILDQIDTYYLKDRDSTLLVYTINYISCCMELGELDKANELFDTQLPVLTPYNKKLKKSIGILLGQRLFLQGKYDESYEQLKKLIDEDISRRQFLAILFLLGKIDEIRGNSDLAKKRYEKIVKLGNRLHLVQLAKERLADL